MSAGYELVNQTKKEKISFFHLPVSTRNEIVGNPVSASIVSWYMLNNQGDNIQFVSDTYEDWPFLSGQRGDQKKYPDQTESLISKLINLGVLKDNGIAYQDEDAPENIYIREISHIWLNQNIT